MSESAPKSAEETAQARMLDAATRMQQQYVRCLEKVSRTLDDLTVNLLRTSCAQNGCPLPATFFSCEPCQRGPEELPQEPGFTVDEQGQARIVFCQEQVEQQKQKDVLIDMRRGLTKSFDHCRGDIDWTDPEHCACAEIRSNMFSGECNYYRLAFRFEQFRTEPRGFQRCLREVAARNLQERGVVTSESAAKQAIELVFDSCFNDQSPFDTLRHTYEVF
ncbi:MAG: hypothetical protein MHM6MM_000050 [Cercozoa sp. M6MM]